MPQRPIPDFTVLIDGKADDTLIPISVQRSTGGARLDYATLQVDPNASRARITELAVQRGSGSTVQIIGELEGSGKFVYFWGMITRERLSLRDREEKIEYIARVEPWHFGYPIRGRDTANPSSPRNKQPGIPSDLPCTFNQEIDGRAYGNESEAISQLGNFLFVDAESIRSPAARTFQKVNPASANPADDPTLWDVADAIYYLCNTLNPQQQWILNPDLSKLSDALSAQPPLRDLRLRDGLYLPHALDELLEPIGFSWFLRLDPDPKKKPQIVVYDRLAGTKHVGAFLQAPGEALDTYKSNLAEMDLEFDISACANDVLGLGDYFEVEATFKLQKLWDANLDDLIEQFYLLKRSHPDFLKHGYQDVWRKWGLNEAGDYIGLRPELTQPYDFSNLQNISAAAAVPRRRRFLPTLTLGPDLRPIGKKHGCRIWYPDPNNNNAPKDLTSNVHVLETECSIYFDDEDLATDLFLEWVNSNASPPPLYITATVRFDQRLSAESVSKPGTSPLKWPNVTILDLANRFRRRWVDPTSEFHDAVRAGTYTALEDDDTQPLQDYCDRVRSAWDMASIHGTLAIEGVDDWRQPPAYETGQALTEVTGRNLSLNARPGGTAVYPQIVGVTYQFQQQRTLLQLDRWKAPAGLFRRENLLLTDHAGALR